MSEALKKKGIPGNPGGGPGRSHSSAAAVQTAASTAIKTNKITVGICAMDKKARSKPMTEILSRFPNDKFEITIFGDQAILFEDIESWPICECLVAFASGKYPTQKVLKYIEMRKPFLINNLYYDEEILKDRRKVYRLLQENGINTPKCVFVERDKPGPKPVIEEFDDYIVVNGTQINKPLVEKPVDADDHSVYIYYPMSAGGGSKRLFRKVEDRSSEFYQHVNEIRREGSYIYEEFIITQGTDVKVYTVGPNYGHAEARKSPVVDGKVNRDPSGREVRYPVILSPLEKEISRKITIAFKQFVCGFDILRVGKKPYVCDVNGWSFVKNSRKYYDDASQVLVNYMLKTLRPYDKGIPLISNSENVRRPSLEVKAAKLVKPVMVKEEEELRAVIAIIRHGDRTPKQKMKVVISEPLFLNYFHEYAKSPRKELKVKSKSALIKFLETTKSMINVIVERRKKGIEMSEDQQKLYRKLKQVRDVFEYSPISGINRKLQMKPQKWENVGIPDNEKIDKDLDGESCEKKEKATEILLIVKWGGDLTPLGREQAETLGASFRQGMYPGQGGGVLRLHASYRHDLKIKASDEGRVMKTAAAFTKGLLELEGQLTPILVSLVTVEEKSRQMLDKGGNDEIKEVMDRCKYSLDIIQEESALNETRDRLSEKTLQKISGSKMGSVRAGLLRLGNPRDALKRMHKLIGQICSQLAQLSSQEIEHKDDEAEHNSPTDISSSQSTQSSSGNTTTSSTDRMSRAQSPAPLLLSESVDLMLERWEKINKDFWDYKKDKYDLTKVPDVYDMIRYDVLHNSHLQLNGMDELFHLSMAFADCVVPQEYGINEDDKRVIGSKLCGALLEKIKYDMMVVHNNFEDDMHYSLDHSHAEDLEIKTIHRTVRTRLYFTSESHLHSILNVLRYPGEGHTSAFSEQGIKSIEDEPELGYLTQVVFRLFESKTDSNNHRFRVEILFSAGAANDPLVDKSASLKPYVALNSNIEIEDMMSYLDTAILAGNQEEEGEGGGGEREGEENIDTRKSSKDNSQSSSIEDMSTSSFSTLSTKTTKQSLEQRMQQQMRQKQQDEEEEEDHHQQQQAEEEFMNLSMDEPPQFRYMDDNDPSIFNSGSSLSAEEKKEREKLSNVFQDGAQYLTHPPSNMRAFEGRTYLGSDTFVAPNTEGPIYGRSSRTSLNYNDSNITVVSGSRGASDQWERYDNLSTNRRRHLSSPMSAQRKSHHSRTYRSQSEPVSSDDIYLSPPKTRSSEDPVFVESKRSSKEATPLSRSLDDHNFLTGDGHFSRSGSNDNARDST